MGEESEQRRLSRRNFMKVGAAGAVALAGLPLLQVKPAESGRIRIGTPAAHGAGAGYEQELQALPAGFSPFHPSGVRVKQGLMDPGEFLTHFDYGRVSTQPDGRTLREFKVVSLDTEITVASGVKYPAWTYNGQVPGPTLRCTEGDLVRIHFTNAGTHPHNMHFHGLHAANMDGVFEVIPAGEKFTYEFEAEPFGLHLYHCHVMPVKKHIEKGLYGTFIVDPKTPRLSAREMVMVMNGFDVNFDEENEFYTVNGVANYYKDNPIEIRAGELVRIYLVNMTEFDPVNSIHTHAAFFRAYRTGTRLDQYEFTDTLTLGMAERAILELTYKHKGLFVFHAHQSEFSELGWLGLFRVT